jgi:hypothetical protein
MSIASRSRSPRADIVHQLRQLQRLSRVYARQSQQGYFRALAQLLGTLACSFDASREPTEWLFAVATMSRRSAEAHVLRRLRMRSRP